MANLQSARNALEHFEAHLGLESSLRHLAEGLDYLDEVLASKSAESEIANNIGRTYFNKTSEFIKRKLEGGAETEPALEVLYRTVIEFEGYEFGDKEQLSKLKRDTFTQLFNSYYQGYTQEEKKKAIQEILNEIST